LIADFDGDGIRDLMDRCMMWPSAPGNLSCPELVDADADGDGIPNGRDSCVVAPNPSQSPMDACLRDQDLDGVPNDRDNCIFVANPDQALRLPGLGVACSFAE
jgi:hypothetical protein